VLITLIRSSAKVLLGIVLFLGLPLLGWGLADVSGFASSGGRMAYAAVVIILQVLVVILFPSPGEKNIEGVEAIPRQRLAVTFLQLLSIGVFIVAGYTDRRATLPIGGSHILRYLGILLFALGFLTVNWVEWVLGRRFSIQVKIQRDHQLVTDGPFRIIRHPRYLGILTFTLGASLAFNSWLALALVGGLLVVLMWRIEDEEKLMGAHFGAEWEAYCARTWRLIPLVY
jgi:protein-S-isoprenylcysteine O-methyltransferase Ste14